jgi:hypothetical protein
VGTSSNEKFAGMTQSDQFRWQFLMPARIARMAQFEEPEEARRFRIGKPSATLLAMASRLLLC